MTWELYVTDELDEWLEELKVTDLDTHDQVVDAIAVLKIQGPVLGRPLVDRIKGSALHNLKELRPGSAKRTEVRILFLFDPWRNAVLLTGGNKAGKWKAWYEKAIPEAERIYAIYLTKRAKEQGDG